MKCATVTNNYRLSGLRQHKHIIVQLWRSEVQNELKSRHCLTLPPLSRIRTLVITLGLLGLFTKVSPSLGLYPSSHLQSPLWQVRQQIPMSWGLGQGHLWGLLLCLPHPGTNRHGGWPLSALNNCYRLLLGKTLTTALSNFVFFKCFCICALWTVTSLAPGTVC